jgi:hypothetical protein
MQIQDNVPAGPWGGAGGELLWTITKIEAGGDSCAHFRVSYVGAKGKVGTVTSDTELSVGDTLPEHLRPKQ